MFLKEKIMFCVALSKSLSLMQHPITENVNNSCKIVKFFFNNKNVLYHRSLSFKTRVRSFDCLLILNFLPRLEYKVNKDSSILFTMLLLYKEVLKRSIYYECIKNIRFFFS